MDPIALAAGLTIAGAIVAGMMALYGTTAQPRQSLQRRLGTILNAPGFDISAIDFQGLRDKRTGKMPLISSLLEGKDWTSQMALQLERADIKLTVSEYVAMRIFSALVVGSLPLFLIHGGVLRILLALVGIYVGSKIPSMYVNMAHGRRLKKLDAQLPDTLSMISNSLKAGFGIMQALDLASRELEHPISTELRRTMYDINVGSTTEDALTNMAKRNDSPDLDIVVTAMLIQQSTGGNLAEILDNVAHTMRERIRIRGEIKTLTTQQMATGFVIGGLPVVMAVLLYLMNPTYMSPLFTENIGRVMLVGAALLETFGVLLIKRVLAIEV